MHNSSSSLETVIKSTARVVGHSTAPVIVVGLPRSGSSYLAHVLSCLDDWFVFDDLYPYQKAAALGISTSSNLAENQQLLEKLINSLTWQLRAKIKFEENFYIPELSLEDTFDMERSLLQALNTNPLTWSQVLEEWMMRLARHCGKHRWGYKTPQDFMHMDELTDTFPGVKFIYILRDPRKMMRSFKGLPRVKTHGSQDGESRQYHPVVYSLYWKKAYEKVQDFIQRGRAPVEVVKFEDLVKTPEAVADRLAAFLDTQVCGQVALDKRNSSFKGSSSKELTQTEMMICERIAGSCMRSAGYELHHPRPNGLDIIDLLNTSAIFTTYQVQRLVTDKRARASILTFLQSLLGK
ncbi:sulfotransferase [Sphaerothrix gracilis]|uniref:sulfotransferase family protein n=1 Tax=Sphaerothrix gracilis TaxID=3151835 RepID=UPI0031FD17E4